MRKAGPHPTKSISGRDDCPGNRSAADPVNQISTISDQFAEMIKDKRGRGKYT